MKLLSLEIKEQFRSLHADFKITFHHLNEKGILLMNEFQPFCFAGLNGSGKSNVLEALSSIFSHLEFCVAKFRPEDFEKTFDRTKCSPDAFVLKYLICSKNETHYKLSNAEQVIISKENGLEPRMFIGPGPLAPDQNVPSREVLLVPSSQSKEKAPGKEFLPDLVVGYSSGENEILSLPYIKSRLIHFDEYKEAVIENYPFSEPETSLIYIDEEMSQAVLLACILFEDPNTTLKPLEDELGIVGIRSFRMNLNVHNLSLDDSEMHRVPILQHIDEKIQALKKCASSYYERTVEPDKSNDNVFSVLTLDFYVDQNTKDAFRDHFKSTFELFRFLQVLYELNGHSITQEDKMEVYKSEGVYTDGKLPIAGPKENVFYFLDYMILKRVKGIEKPIELLLRQFSDGEHQFIHTMGICLMLKERRTLLLLDEPETHFNPGWRAKFIKVLNDSLKAGGANHFLKDILLTSHSPFIISDCLPNNVIFFKRDPMTHKIKATSAKDLDFNTYGTSVEIILDELFEYNQSIGDWANEHLKKIDFTKIKDKSDVERIKTELKILGDSIEKDLVLARLNNSIK